MSFLTTALSFQHLMQNAKAIDSFLTCFYSLSVKWHLSHSDFDFRMWNFQSFFHIKVSQVPLNDIGYKSDKASSNNHKKNTFQCHLVWCKQCEWVCKRTIWDEIGFCSLFQCWYHLSKKWRHFRFERLSYMLLRNCFTDILLWFIQVIAGLVLFIQALKQFEMKHCYSNNLILNWRLHSYACLCGQCGPSLLQFRGLETAVKNVRRFSYNLATQLSLHFN